VEKNYDFVIIDSAPTLGEEAKAVLHASDGNFIVTTADEPTLHASLAAAKMINSNGNHTHGLIINKMRDQNYQFDVAELEKATGIPVVACLPDDVNVNRALFTQIPASVYKKNSAFASELSKLSASLAGISAKPGIFERIFGANKKAADINREVLRNEFYTSIFEN
jgi:MinD-like ATPase involved in chromosome partitioning or flagellar assembly